MAKQYNMDRKNISRREETMRVREERVITGYVRYTHPEVYKEAYEFYNNLNKVYPQKKDLRRTNEYEMLKNEETRKMRKYYSRKAPKVKIVQDKMVLRIPLMPKNDTETVIQPVDIPISQQVTVETTTQETTTQQVTVETTTQEEPVMTGLEPLDDQTLTEIIQDLHKDPDFSNMFDNIDFEIDNCPLW